MAPKSTLKLFAVTDLVAIIVARFSRWLNCPCRLTDADGTARDTQWIGRYGEKVAAAWLRSQRCRILATNFRGPRGGEIDIVARQGRLLLFVEVKTRRGNPKIRPFDAVNKEKIALIERGANAWLRRLGTRRLPWRFDVIEVLLEEGNAPQVNQIKNAF